MSAHAEYSREREAVDALLAKGYVIVGITEGLDGMMIRFRRSRAAAGSGVAPASVPLGLAHAVSDGGVIADEASADGGSEGTTESLRLLNADARKYAGYRLRLQLAGA